MVAFNQFYLTLKRSLKQLALSQLAVRTVCLLMVTVIAIGGVWSPTAMAVGSQKAADVVNERAAAELDRVSGAGTSDKLGGTVQETVGKAKRGAANLTDGFLIILWAISSTVQPTNSTAQPMRSRAK